MTDIFSRPSGDYLTAEDLASMVPAGRYVSEGPENSNCHFCGEPTKMRAYRDTETGKFCPAFCSRPNCLDKLDEFVDARDARRET